MKSKTNRRKFIKTGTQICAGGCLLMMSPELFAGNSFSKFFQDVPDPKKMNTYCTYNCTDECKFKQATLKNEPELKKKVYEEWNLKERVGEFDADKFFCYGCKVENEKMGPLVQTCTVRKCCIEKGYDACIQCDKIASCDKDLWKNFPQFQKSVIEMRKKYLEAQG